MAMMDGVEWCGRGAAPREAVEDNTMAMFLDIIKGAIVSSCYRAQR